MNAKPRQKSEADLRAEEAAQRMREWATFEAGALGSLFVDPRLIGNPRFARVLNRAECWPNFGDLASVVRRFIAQGKPLDLLLVAKELRADPQRTTKDDDLRKMFSSFPNAAHGEYYAAECEKAAARESAAQAASAILTDLHRGRDIGAILESTGEWLGRMTESTAKEPTLPELLTAGQLDLGDFRVDYLCDGVLVKGQPGIVAAPQKGCKTSTMVDLSVSLVTGGDFLGKFFCRRSKVLFLSGESGMGTLQETFRRVCVAKDTTLSKLEGLHVSSWLPQFADGRDLDTLRKMLEQTEADVLLIDPVYLCMTGDDAGNLFKMGAMLRAVALVAAEFGVTLLLIHHTKRGIGVDPFAMPELSWIAWAGFSEFARQWILLNRRETYEPGSGLHRLWLTVGGSAGHSGAWGLNIDEGKAGRIGGRLWDVTLRPAGEIIEQDRESRLQFSANRKEQQQTAKEQREETEIIKALAKEPLTQTKLADAAKLSHKAAKAAIARMLERDPQPIVPAEVKTAGGTFQGFMLAKVGQGIAGSDKVLQPDLIRGGSDKGAYIGPRQSVPTLPGMEEDHDEREAG